MPMTPSAYQMTHPRQTPQATATPGNGTNKYDSTNNLILTGARPYDPSAGRFLAIDPVEGGSLNNYGYAGQDPINMFDLNGDRIPDIVWRYDTHSWVPRQIASSSTSTSPLQRNTTLTRPTA